MKNSVLILAGSKSDLELVEKIQHTLNEFGVKYEIQIVSAHRQPDKLRKIVRNSTAKVFIATAGLAAHLPGVVASFTIKPVIGLPKSTALSGVDSFLSIVQMPNGVPVATVGIDMAENAALLACQILALTNKKLEMKLKRYKKELAK
ncbi:MAG: 5-(carboxyamino)imidazole ribonucleotide mutase [Elusimicrobiota bacterium]|nr:5-(carboxyamino)imidazole ribonucleotide mutase [Elusimicrobiota bacterium]